jgi:hypothetical protein
MRKFILINIVSIMSMVLSLSFCLQAVEIMKLSEIKPGMEGVGKSTLKGNQVEIYSFKVLGIIENFAPHKNLIIVKLDSPELNNGGIVSGMSGSPAYIDGKLIGAIAYGFTFYRQTIFQRRRWNLIRKTWRLSRGWCRINWQKGSISQPMKRFPPFA